jgi:predicted alpha/beta-hydrolase family hydrolase
VTASYPARGDTVGATFILAHGAGAGQKSAFIVALATELAEQGVAVVTFDFPYMERGGRVPDRAPVLEARYREVIERVTADAGPTALFIGGKSMGGRIASQVAAADSALAIAGLVLLGYPLHPPGQPLKRRDAHLPAIRRPILVVQGSRDTFGTPEELAPAFSTLDPPATVHVIAGGDHSFAAGSRKPAPLTAIAAIVRDWIREHVTRAR